MNAGTRILTTAALALTFSAAPVAARPLDQMSGEEIGDAVLGFLEKYLTMIGRASWHGSPPGQEHLRKERQAQAWRQLLAHAQQGDRQAQATVGVMLLAGQEPAPKKPADGVAWLKKAALQGDADAQRTLAALYLDGQEGIAKNLPEAVTWLRLLAQGGDDDARRLLVPLLVRGAGVPRHHREALRYALPLAADGAWEFQALAGRLLLGGQGVPRNPAEAATWLRLAAAQGHAESQAVLGQLYATGDGVAQSLDHAAFWLGHAAAQGHPTAQALLGTSTLHGHGVPKDAARALTLLHGAADHGVASAQTLVGTLYEAGADVPQQYVLAAQWYGRAAGQGVGAAAHRLGVLYALGQGVPQDYAQAHRWFTIAAARAATPEAAQAARDERATLAPHLSARQQERAAELVSAWSPKEEPTPAPIEGLGPPVEAAPLRARPASGAVSGDGTRGGPDPTLQEAQTRLTAHGYTPGPADGRRGARTRAALRQFQTAAGLPVTGVLDPATLAALRAAPASRTAGTR